MAARLIADRNQDESGVLHSRDEFLHDPEFRRIHKIVRRVDGQNRRGHLLETGFKMFWLLSVVLFQGYFSTSTLSTESQLLNIGVDSLTIVSISPASPYRPGVPVDLTVEVDVILSSADSAVLRMGFNSRAIASFVMPANGSAMVHRGRLHVTLHAPSIVPVDWAEKGDFKILVNMGPIVVPGQTWHAFATARKPLPLFRSTTNSGSTARGTSTIRGPEIEPTVRDIIQRHLSRVRSLVASGTPGMARIEGVVEIPALRSVSAVSPSFVLLLGRPDRVLMTSQLIGIGSQVQGASGNHAWISDTPKGDRLVVGTQAAAILGFRYLLTPSVDTSDWSALSSGGSREFDEIRAYKVIRKEKGGARICYYFGISDGLLRGMTYSREGKADEVTFTQRYSNYKTFGYGLVATRVELITKAFKSTHVVRQVTYGPLDSTVFLPPAAIAELVKP